MSLLDELLKPGVMPAHDALVMLDSLVDDIDTRRVVLRQDITAWERRKPRNGRRD